jgi:hypothetical protein
MGIQGCSAPAIYRFQTKSMIHLLGKFWTLSSFTLVSQDWCPEMSVHNYHTTLRNIPEECRSQLSVCASLVKRKQDKIITLKTANKSFQSMAKFTYLEVVLTNENCTHVKVKQIKSWECALPFTSQYVVS